MNGLESCGLKVMEVACEPECLNTTHKVSPLWTAVTHANAELCARVGGRTPTGGIVKGVMQVGV